ncbi:hypothetical protein K8I28_06235 [bacterium]|nr:hypothetical protein [bacterium]
MNNLDIRMKHVASYMPPVDQKVFEETRPYTAGSHLFQFSSRDANAELSSGMYILQVGFEDQHHIQKVMMMK